MFRYSFLDLEECILLAYSMLSKDPDPLPSSTTPNFILKLNNEEELTFNFKFIIRQSQQSSSGNDNAAATSSTVDTVLNGLTYVSASTAREVENLVTLEFHADPNLHKNANVQLMGDYSTGGSKSVTFDWSWKWRPPKAVEDRGGGWRNTCSVWLSCALVRYPTDSWTVCRVRSTRA
jgi:Arf-GAP/SH3 domain/ANK repeat/PH domain-containing protein